MNLKRIVDNYINFNTLKKVSNTQNIDKEIKNNNKTKNNNNEFFVLPCKISFEDYLNVSDFSNIKDRILERDNLDNEELKIK